MIEPVSRCKKPCVQFRGANDNNNFTGVNAASSGHAETLSARDTYSNAVQDANQIKLKFTAPKGVGENLNVKG